MMGSVEDSGYEDFDQFRDEKEQQNRNLDHADQKVKALFQNVLLLNAMRAEAVGIQEINDTNQQELKVVKKASELVAFLLSNSWPHDLNPHIEQFSRDVFMSWDTLLDVIRAFRERLSKTIVC